MLNTNIFRSPAILGLVVVITLILLANFSVPICLFLVTKNAYLFFKSFCIWNVITTIAYLVLFTNMGQN